MQVKDEIRCTKYILCTNIFLFNWDIHLYVFTKIEFYEYVYQSMIATKCEGKWLELLSKKKGSLSIVLFTDYGRPMKPFSAISQTFGPIGQIGWIHFGVSIWGIFGQTISILFGTVSPLSMISIIQLFFSIKKYF